MSAIRVALALWVTGLVCERDLIAWADHQILRTNCPSDELLELSLHGPVVCLKRPEFEFPARPIRFTFVEEFSLRASVLELSSDIAAPQFIEWASRHCMGEDLEQPEVRLGYQLDHLYVDCGDTQAAVSLLRQALPLLLPHCRAIASVFLAQVPTICFM